MPASSKKRSLIAAVVALAVLAIGALLLFKKGGQEKGSEPGPLVRDDLVITRVFASGKERDHGYVYLPYTRTEASTEHRFVNLAVDLNGDGAFASFDTEAGRQEEWLVRNMPSGADGGGTSGFSVRIPDRGFQSKLPLRAEARFSETMLADGTWPAESAGVTMALHVRTYEIDDRDERYVTDGTGDLDTGSPGAGGRRLAVVRSAPANDASEPPEYVARNTDVPDQDQKYNECSPTGISNNFRWLAKKYGFEDRMPDTTDTLIDELKGDLLWDNGVTPGENTINGKNAFIERHGLPLEAHLIGGEFDPNIQYKIYQEIQKGQAVEVGLLFLEVDADGNEKLAGAHLVGVSSVMRFGSSRFIQLVDPGTRSRDDGSSSETYSLNGNEVLEYDEGIKTVIRFAYAQSPIFDGSGSLVFPDQTGFVLQPGEQPRAADPGRFTMARSNFGFFNVSIDDPGDHMVGESFTARATVTKTSRRTTMGYWDAEGNRRSYTFGAKSPWSLRGHFIATYPILVPDTVTHKPDPTDLSANRFDIETTFTCDKHGLAKVKYVAFLGWTRDGDPRPEGAWDKYRRQIEDPSDIVTVESAPFRCLLSAPEPEPEQPRTAPPPPQPVSCPGVRTVTEGVEIEVLKFEGQCYPVSQFHVAQPDACEKSHWHWNQAPVVSFEGVKRNDPNTSGCGFGTTDQLVPQKIMISQEDAAQFIGGLMER